MTDHAAKAEAWRQADAKRWLIFCAAGGKGEEAGILHMVEAVAKVNGVCSPSGKGSVCGQVPLAQLTSFNGVGYGEHGLREAACLLGRGFCGKCVAGLYGGFETPG